MLEVLPVINYVLCDAVVVWRAWLIWERNTKICIPSFVCLVGTLASTLIIIITQDDTSFVLGSLVLGFLLGSNLWTTSIIAWRAWRHRQFIKTQLGGGTARTNVEKILSLLIESGAIYCFVWSLYFLIFYALRNGAFIPAVILDQLAAIYPLTIIIIVHIRAVSSNWLSQVSSIDFVSPPSGTADPNRYSFTSG
ncbi:hypothetical protein HETIRDRAFT_409359 [Heterobasidion irregulare TC 32-1]|uniref:Uncharacterized protein n=1 Tax=Heterobasidion irregulare (strain TC 32-1) TaxID=747525 RepID=W4K6Q1_HETIT|nr:uncharacterized protein HETIRDRAFT_409359 [Heterobasidion irregulare TC 32-1]ETW81419.1 hypothetical protein HETIRDRAFT_409359 [Heterobasidion irregulare TC 32-1]